MAHCKGEKPLAYPPFLSSACPEAADLMSRLLVRDIRQRLAAAAAAAAAATEAEASPLPALSSASSDVTEATAFPATHGYVALRVRAWLTFPHLDGDRQAAVCFHHSC